MLPDERWGTGWLGRARVALGAQDPQEYSRPQSGKLEALSAELDEGSQVCLADAAYRVDVRAGAVILGQVAEETAREKGWCLYGFWGIKGSGVYQCWPRVTFFQGPRIQRPSITLALEEASRGTLGTLHGHLSWLRMLGYHHQPTGKSLSRRPGPARWS